MSKMENQLNLCINNRFCINKMSFVPRKNTPIEDCGFFSDTMKKAKDAANKGMKKAKKKVNKLNDELKTLSIDDALNTFERDVQLMENGKQFVPPNKL